MAMSTKALTLQTTINRLGKAGCIKNSNPIKPEMGCGYAKYQMLHPIETFACILGRLSFSILLVV